MNALLEMNGSGLDREIGSDGYAADGRVVVDKAVFAAGLAAGGLIGTLQDPFGSGSTFTTIGTVPPQLALSNGTIVKGSGVAVARSTYRIYVQAAAADGARASRSGIDFLAR